MSTEASAEAPLPPAAAAKKEKKGPPPGLVIPPKKPKLTKAERRALQEQQRAAKAAQQGGTTKKQAGGGKAETPPPPKEKVVAETDGTSHTKSSEQQQPQPTHAEATGVAMVSHLAPFRPVQDVFAQGATLRTKIASSCDNLHPAVVQLGYRYAAGEIRGGNARCRHMLTCWQQVLQDFEPADQQQDLRPIVDALLKASFQFWTGVCRPHSVSMGNAYTMIKTATASLDRTTSWDEMRTILTETMQAYTHERIDFAGQAIADLTCRKLLPDEEKGASRSRQRGTNPPTILVYGYSEVVSLVLRQATAQHKAFSVICVDSRPLLEGRRMLEELRAAGVKDCTYILLNALTYVLPNVTTVLVGASALMSDGSIWNRVGTANVALLAQAHNIPVLVCAESYKISNRVQLEALTHNEMGAPPANPQEDKVGDKKNLSPINLLYDLTPAKFVSGIVTELGIVPPTSVAVLLRELNSQHQQA